MEQQKARHYVAQMALSEKQLSILAGDVGVLREEVGALAHSFLALRDSHDQRGLLVSRVRALEEASKATGARWERRLSSIESQLVASINTTSRAWWHLEYILTFTLRTSPSGSGRTPIRRSVCRSSRHT
ncbi:unnamed protein product [Prorocentrum cordatum]|uniref:Uncharacterized protein n=1 Tax=Prorocentrum cordatum TaxID=2364126 RepID=A0ABN9R3X3_9DINO|nr:unnamed protein product [Polarella glacialis]